MYCIDMYSPNCNHALHATTVMENTEVNKYLATLSPAAIVGYNGGALVPFPFTHICFVSRRLDLRWSNVEFNIVGRCELTTRV
jgi:hypothetical protein